MLLHFLHIKLHNLKFACTIFIYKNLPVPCSLFYSSHLVNIYHMHLLNMNHLYFLHFPTIFNYFQNSIFYFLWKLLCLLKLFSHSLPQQSGKSFCCCVMFWVEVNGWWPTTSELGNQFLQKHSNKSTIIFHCLFKKQIPCCSASVRQ